MKPMRAFGWFEVDHVADRIAFWRSVSPCGTVCRMGSSSEVASVESLVERWLDGDDVEISIIGSGEICVVVGWPTTKPDVVYKRLPPDDTDRLEDYASTIERYETELRRRGVEVAPTECCLLETDSGSVLYLRQPRYPSNSIIVEKLRQSNEIPAVFDQVLDAIDIADRSIGVDAQLSNWVDLDGRATLIDTSTPFLVNNDGQHLLDVGVVLRPFPTLLRPVLRRWVVPDIVEQYHDPRRIALDLVANLVKERLADRIETICRHIGARYGAPITMDEATAHYRHDAKLWTTIQRAKQSQRWWEQRIRRRTYPFLIPDDIER